MPDPVRQQLVDARCLPFSTSPARPLVPLIKRYTDHNVTFDMHFEVELGIVLCGRMRRIYPNHQRDLVPGDVWFCGTLEPHGHKVLEAPCEILVLWASLEMLGSVRFEEHAEIDWLSPFTAPPPQRPLVSPAERDTVLAHGREMLAQAHEMIRADIPDARHDPAPATGNGNGNGKMQRPASSPGAYAAVQLRLNYLRLLLNLLAHQPAPTGGAAAKADSFARIGRAVDMVLTSRRFIPVAAAARACNMSPNKFGMLFQQVTGLSFSAFALRHRLHSATTQLRQTDDPLKVIAAEWGFTDAAHFHRCFKAVFRCTPATYRRRASDPHAAGLR